MIIELWESVKMTSYFYIVKIGAFENKLITKAIFFDTLADSHKTNFFLEKNQVPS